MKNWDMGREWPLILEASARYGVDPYAVAAIRVAENGAPGREFGVMSEPARTYAQQLRDTCLTLIHRAAAFAGHEVYDYNGRLCLTHQWAVYFALHWAPIGATNDPLNLNVHWLGNFWSTYLGFVDAGGPVPWAAARS